MADELIWNWRWWWDPIDMEHLKVLEPSVQQQVFAAKLEANAQLLRTQAEALTKISGLIGSAHQTAGGRQR